MFIKEPRILLRDLKNMNQVRIITNLLTGHLHTNGISNTPMDRKCKGMEETSYHVLCK